MYRFEMDNVVNENYVSWHDVYVFTQFQPPSTVEARGSIQIDESEWPEVIQRIYQRDPHVHTVNVDRTTGQVTAINYHINNLSVAPNEQLQACDFN